MNYQIAIPSRRRAKPIGKYTLKYLAETNVPMERVTVFVSDEEDQTEYAELYPDCNVVIAEGTKTLGGKRQFISDYYPSGTPVVSFDDDVSGVFKLVLDEPLTSGKKELTHPCHLEKVTDLESFILEGFTMSEERKIRMWGAYQVANKGFLHPRVVTGLKFIMGHFFGFYAGDGIAGHNADPKDDVYTSLYHYKTFGGTLRFDNHCVKSKAHSGSGGNCDDMEAKLELNNSIVARILEEFPDLASLKLRKSKDPWLSRYHEVRMKSITTEVITDV